MFDAIRPYDDAEMTKALGRVAVDPRLGKIVEYFGFNLQDIRKALLSFRTVKEFQDGLMIPILDKVIEKSTRGLTASGIEHLSEGGKRPHLIVSNHRDIVLDPSFLQYVLFHNGFDYSEIAAGNNLISLRFVADIMRSNRMIIVKRDGNSRDLYDASQQLSAYIRSRVAPGSGEWGRSVWIAQRQGRAKDGCDITEQGLMKMLDMSGAGTFEENFGELSIVPLSISYEYEPCGIKKAREVLMKEMNGSYSKSPFEDMRSIIAGVCQDKGRVHLHFCKPIQAEELSECAALSRNDRYRHLAEIIDNRILEGYKLWPTANYAKAMLAGHILDKDFAAYIDDEVASVSIDCLPEKDLREKLLEIYAAPLRNL